MKKLMRLPAVMKATGLRKTAIYASLRTGFPAPVQLTKRAVAWRADEVEAWIRARPPTRTRTDKLHRG